MPLYDRFATVAIGQPGSTATFVDGLRVKFLVEKSARGEPNKGVVQIWNLNETSRNQITAGRDVMILNAGYRDDEKQQRLAIQMDVIDVQAQVVRPDIVTAMTCRDGVNTLRNKKYSISFGSGYTAKQIIVDLAKRAGVALKGIASIDDVQYQQGFSDVGPIGDILDRVTGPISAAWSFQNGELTLAPKEAPADEYVSQVNEDTGLLGSPIKRNKIGDIFAPLKRVGWIFKSFLNPTIEPNGRVRLKADEVDGTFRVMNVKHQGDNFEGDFISEVEVEEWPT
jgi:hypothetical protein